MDLEKTLEALRQRNFDAQYFEEPEDLRKALKLLVKPEWTVGFGGSATLRQLGIPEYIDDTIGATGLDHWKADLSDEEVWSMRLAHGRCNLFMTSVNACTEDGRLVLVDGVGNRVAAAVFGPGMVIHVFGANKIVPDIHKAFERIEKIAAPKRAGSLNAMTPCVQAQECQNCRSPKRICRAKLILEFAPFATPSKVWIVKGEYGY